MPGRVPPVFPLEMPLLPRPSFRTGFYLGLVVAVAWGLYLFQLWDAGNQVRLHSEHLLVALEKKDWSAVQEFLGPSYVDQWGHDRATVVSRLRQVLPYAKNLRIRAREVISHAADGEGEWRARITLEADPNEVSALILARINPLQEPFTLTWRRASGKPWDWKLVRAANPALQLSDAAGF